MPAASRPIAARWLQGADEDSSPTAKKCMEEKTMTRSPAECMHELDRELLRIAVQHACITCAWIAVNHRVPSFVLMLLPNSPVCYNAFPKRPKVFV